MTKSKTKGKQSTATVAGITFEEYIDRVRAFHGFEAPGVVLGGFMVELAMKGLPEGIIFDAICETAKCLPDAIQLLTPCTTGNGWLTVVNVGRFALTLFNKETGEGLRVFVDPVKVREWPEISAWFFKLKSKKEQDIALLIDEISRAGAGFCNVEQVKVQDRFLVKTKRKGFVICPDCGEAYPVEDGSACLACRGEGMYQPVS